MNDDNGHGHVFKFGVLCGVTLITLIFSGLLTFMPPYTKYKINDKVYLVSIHDEKFIKTDSIEIVNKDGILEIKEK